MLQSCVIYHFKGNFVSIQDVLISPIFGYVTYESFCQIGSHVAYGLLGCDLQLSSHICFLHKMLKCI